MSGNHRAACKDKNPRECSVIFDFLMRKQNSSIFALAHRSSNQKTHCRLSDNLFSFLLRVEMDNETISTTDEKEKAVVNTKQTISIEMS